MEPRDQEIGAQAREFTLPGIGGGKTSLSTLLDGKKGALVVFWSGVCSHCIRYDAYLNGFARRYPDLGFTAIASRAGETPDQIRETMAARGIDFSILHDAGSAVARQWASMQTPRAYLVDAERVLRYRGAIDNFKYPGDPEYQDHLERAMADLLAGRPVQRAETASFGCAVQSVYYTLPRHL